MGGECVVIWASAHKSSRGNPLIAMGKTVCTVVWEKKKERVWELTLKVNQGWCNE